MNGARKACQITPGGSGGSVVTIRFRVQVTNPGSVGTTQVADMLVQSGNTATGWVPHVTEMPWTAGIVGG